MLFSGEWMSFFQAADSTMGQGGIGFLRGRLVMFSALMLYSYRPIPRGYGLETRDE
jgi:hypothetical protein